MKDGGSAFPREDYQCDQRGGQPGMCLRDWFAGMALASVDETRYDQNSQIAYACYERADGMITERERRLTNDDG